MKGLPTTMTQWFHRYRRMREKLHAMTELNQALCEANMELTAQIERLKEGNQDLKRCYYLTISERDEVINRLREHYNRSQ